jgi:hypothetical protein
MVKQFKTVRLCRENIIPRYYSPLVEETSKMPHQLIQHRGKRSQNIVGPSEERSSGNGAHDAPEDVSPIRGAVPGTEEAHDGQGTGISKGREVKEVGDAGRFL